MLHVELHGETGASHSGSTALAVFRHTPGRTALPMISGGLLA